MISLEEVFQTALKAGFQYAIIFYKDGAIKLAVGLNGLTKKTNDTLLSYMNLLEKLNVKYNVEVYNVLTRDKIDITDIPMFFSVDLESGKDTRPNGYM